MDYLLIDRFDFRFVCSGKKKESNDFPKKRAICTNRGKEGRLWLFSICDKALGVMLSFFANSTWERLLLKRNSRIRPPILIGSLLSKKPGGVVGSCFSLGILLVSNLCAVSAGSKGVRKSIFFS